MQLPESVADDPKPRAEGRRAFLLWLIVLGLTCFAVFVRMNPPPPRVEPVAATAFSAERARATLADLLGDGSPHPVGSASNARVRDRLLATLERLGTPAAIQRADACSARARCATVENVVAIVPGTRAEPELLLAAHYDSVAKGPGASDDGAGVAALIEVIRAIRSGPLPPRSIAVLFSDGEELGLLGAEAFVANHPLFKGIRVVVNLEARGVSGPSMLFETGPDDAWLIDIAARAIERPVTGSLFRVVYELMPNDTDASVFKRHGVAIANFAFLRGAARYHTGSDDLAHLDLGSLQHHGDNALAMTRALVATDFAHVPHGDAAWLDLFALTILRVPAGACAPLAGASLIALLACAWIRRRAASLDVVPIARASLFSLAFAIAAILAAHALMIAIRSAGALPTAFAESTWPYLAAVASATAGLALATSSRIAPARPVEAWLGVWIPWSAVALVVAAWRPQASPLLLAPAVVAAMSSAIFLRPRRPFAEPYAPLLSAHAAAIVWLPLARLLPDTLGLGAIVAVPIVAVAIASLPTLMATPARDRRAAIAASVGSLAVFVAIALTAR
jgi:hypothetical protein